MELEIKHIDTEVTVNELGWGPMLRISLSDRIQEDGTLKKQLVVGTSSCLSGDFDSCEAQARAYVNAFELARKVLLSESRP